MTDRLLSLLGLCRRAGKIVLGNDPVIDSIAQKKAKLIIVASDCSKNTAKGILSTAHRCNIPTHIVPYTKEEISLALGKYTAVLAICDQGFAKKVDTLICLLKEE